MRLVEKQVPTPGPGGVLVLVMAMEDASKAHELVMIDGNCGKIVAAAISGKEE